MCTRIIHILCANVSCCFKIGKLVDTLSVQLENKGKELNSYREKHGIRIRGEDDSQEEKSSDAPKSGTSGVLVAKDNS